MEKSRYKRRIILSFIGLGLLILAVALTSKARHAVQTVHALNALLASMQQKLVELDHGEFPPDSIASLQTDLHHAQTLIADLKQTVWPFNDLAKSLGWVPRYGDDIVAISYSLDEVEALLNCADHLSEVLLPMLDYQASTGTQTLSDAASLLADSEPQLVEARSDLDAAKAARAHIAATQGLIPELQAPIAQMDRAIPALELTLDILDVAPTVLGIETSQHILILLQNEDELRPTGGWITASIYVVLNQGQIEEMKTLISNSAEIDRFQEYQYGAPPVPMRDYMHLPIWAFRDANWSPDFPTSAAKAAELYTLGTGLPIDTVIAVDQQTIRDLLAAVGPILLTDGTLVDHTNVIGYMQQEWADTYKAFIPQLAPGLVEATLDVNSPSDIVRRAQALRQIATRNDFLVYTDDRPTQAIIEQLGWDGSISAQSGDYLFLVEANIGYNKVNLNITRDLEYHLNLRDPAHPYAVLTLTYVNNSEGPAGICPLREVGNYELFERSYFERQRTNDCYGSYLRIYLPNGTQMVDPPRFDLPDTYSFTQDAKAGQIQPLFDERGKEVYGGLVVVLPGIPQTTSFTYLLPPGEIFAVQPDGTIQYKLLVQKQPGVPAYPVKVTIDLPVGAEIIETDPAPAFQNADELFYETQLAADLGLGVVIQLDESTQQALSANLTPFQDTQLATHTPRFVPTSPPQPIFGQPTVTPGPTATFRPIIEVTAAFDAGLLAGPDETMATIQRVASGDVLAVLGRNEIGGWLLVRTADGTLGWVPFSITTDSFSLRSLPVVAYP